MKFKELVLALLAICLQSALTPAFGTEYDALRATLPVDVDIEFRLPLPHRLPSDDASLELDGLRFESATPSADSHVAGIEAVTNSDGLVARKVLGYHDKFGWIAYTLHDKAVPGEGQSVHRFEITKVARYVPFDLMQSKFDPQDFPLSELRPFLANGRLAYKLTWKTSVSLADANSRLQGRLRAGSGCPHVNLGPPCYRVLTKGFATFGRIDIVDEGGARRIEASMWSSMVGGNAQVVDFSGVPDQAQSALGKLLASDR